MHTALAVFSSPFSGNSPTNHNLISISSLPVNDWPRICVCDIRVILTGIGHLQRTVSIHYIVNWGDCHLEFQWSGKMATWGNTVQTRKISQHVSALAATQTATDWVAQITDIYISKFWMLGSQRSKQRLLFFLGLYIAVILLRAQMTSSLCMSRDKEEERQREREKALMCFLTRTLPLSPQSVGITQLCRTLCDRILQARILERVAIPFSRGSFQARDRSPQGPILMTSFNLNYFLQFSQFSRSVLSDSL